VERGGWNADAEHEAEAAVVAQRYAKEIGEFMRMRRRLRRFQPRTGWDSEGVKAADWISTRGVVSQS